MSPSSQHPDLKALISQWRGPLVGLFLARGVDRSTAHELAEDVFVEAWLGLSGNAPGGHFRGDPTQVAALGVWLRGIARNLAAAHQRRLRRTGKTVSSSELTGVPVREEPDARDGDELRRAVDRLPRSLREVVLVRYLDERTGAEAAAILGLTAKALEQRAARARSLLKELLEETRVNR